jgi:predicted nucleotidyltransferase
MGYKLDATEYLSRATLRIPWLDTDTGALVDEIVEALARAFPDLLAVILYGSIARHDERPLDDEIPSDVDLLAIFDSDDERITDTRGMQVSGALDEPYMRHLDAPREISVLRASRTLREWDPTFVANVARDGILLFARGPLPEPLAPVAERAETAVGD